MLKKEVGLVLRDELRIDREPQRRMSMLARAEGIHHVTEWDNLKPSMKGKRTS